MLQPSVFHSPYFLNILRQLGMYSKYSESRQRHQLSTFVTNEYFPETKFPLATRCFRLLMSPPPMFPCVLFRLPSSKLQRQLGNTRQQDATYCLYVCFVWTVCHQWLVAFVHSRISPVVKNPNVTNKQHFTGIEFLQFVSFFVMIGLILLSRIIKSLLDIRKKFFEMTTASEMIVSNQTCHKAGATHAVFGAPRTLANYRI